MVLIGPGLLGQGKPQATFMHVKIACKVESAKVKIWMKNSLSLLEPSANGTKVGVGRVARCLRKNGLQIVADAWVTASWTALIGG